MEKHPQGPVELNSPVTYFGSQGILLLLGSSWEPTLWVRNGFNFGGNAQNGSNWVHEPEWNQFHVGENGLRVP